MDVRFAGIYPAIEFVRHFTSGDRWADWSAERLALGWFHTFDERLFRVRADGDVEPLAASSEDLVLVHRQATGRGRQFTCPAPHDPASSFSCTTVDGSLATLSWNPTTSIWELDTGDGLTTTFQSNGLLLGKKTTRGVGWDIVRSTSDTRRIDYVEDSLGRRLVFEYVNTLVSSLRDGTGQLLATFERDNVNLVGADSAAGDENYAYVTGDHGQGLILTPYLTEVRQAGDVVLNVAYSYDSTYEQGTVSALQAGTAAFSFRYANDARNTCAVPSRSTQIVDRSTDPVAQSSCTDDAAGDSWCASAAGIPAVCDAGTCRAITCIEFEIPPGETFPSASNAIEVDGNCACGGDSQRVFSSVSAEAPRRLTHEIAKDGTITSYGYDTRGRLIAQCVNDNDYTVTTTPSSCPSTGVFRSYEYTRQDLPALLTKNTRRSRLSAAAMHQTVYTYDPTHAELTQRSETGVTRTTANDTNVTETQTTTYSHDSLGRRTQVVLPAGETTTYTCHSQAGNQYGLVATEERHLSGGAVRLTTTYTAYSPLGMPTSVTLPSGAVRSQAYAYGGMRMTSSSIAGQTTAYTFDEAGRLEIITEPSGQRTVSTYDSLGRIQFIDVRDSASTLAGNRTEYQYDAAGRRTLVARRRVDAAGVPQAIEWQLGATYDEHGFTAAQAYGARADIAYTYDTHAMGRLEEILLEDSDQRTMQHDAFGRETEYRRHFGGSSGAYLSSYANASGNATREGLPTSITDPHSVVRSYLYDDFGRLVRSQSNDHGTVRWGYQMGRLAERKIGSGVRTVYSYDDLGRVTFIDNNADSPTLVGQDYQFIYDNGSLACGVASSTNCAWRDGRLGKVLIEFAPGNFWTMEYDYAQDGQVNAELWPGGDLTKYDHDAQGRLVRMHYPVQTGDKLRYEYEAIAGNDEQPTELSRIVGELTPGTDYVVWARALRHDASGQLTEARLADRPDSQLWSMQLTYNTDGSPQHWRVRRRNGSTNYLMIYRTYSYWPDGMVKGWTTSVSSDPARTFFYDGANRLTCAARYAGAASCPASGNQNLLESYAYDAHENRLSRADNTGTTTYYNPYNNNSLWDEYPPGHTIWYGYDANTLGGRTYDYHQSVSDPNQRNFYYYPTGQLRSIEMTRPGAQAPDYDSHSFTILYDHIGRPIYIADKNNDTGKERREELFWDRSDRLVNRIITPDHTAPTVYTVDVYAHLESAVTGWFRLNYGGGGDFEQRYYTVMDPTGLPAAVYRWYGESSSVGAWTASYRPFGEIDATVGAPASPRVFTGHDRVEGSAVARWNGSTPQVLRSEVALTRARGLDPRTGQFLSAEPVTVDPVLYNGWLHPYAYALSSAPNYGDPNGEWPVGPLDPCVLFPSVCDNLCSLLPGVCVPYPLPDPCGEWGPPPRPPFYCSMCCDDFCGDWVGMDRVVCTYRCLNLCRSTGYCPEDPIH